MRNEGLEACYDDEARLTTPDGRGKAGTTKISSGEAIERFHEALIKVNYIKREQIESFSVYGNSTWNAVIQLKKDKDLGWTHMGDAGPKTMDWLNKELSVGDGKTGGDELPPKPPTLPPFYPPPAPPVPVPPPVAPFRSRIDLRGASANVPYGLPILHSFIVHYDSAKRAEFYTRGGHTADKPEVCPGVGRKKRSWGDIFKGECPEDDPKYRAVGVGPVEDLYRPGTVDWPALGSRTVLTGPDSDTKPSCFEKEAKRISDKCIPYSPCGPNSNSVTYTLLTNCGMEPGSTPPGGHYPGWGTLL